MKTPPIRLVNLMLKLGMDLPEPENAPFPDNWKTLTADERYDFLIKAYISTDGRDFDTPEAAQGYQRRAQRLADIIALKEPDRIPNILVADSFILKYGGATEKDAWYNPMKVLKASQKYIRDFELDYANVAPVYPGKVCDLFGLNLIKWPGSNIPGHALRSEQSFQYIEGEYMSADEYDELIADPTLYLLTKYIPRICPGLKGLEAFSGAAGGTTASSLMFFLLSFAMGPAKQGFKTLQKGAKLLMQDMMPGVLGGLKFTSRYGLPDILGGFSIAPFDIVGDTLRGTKGIMLDMFRQPEKLAAACDAVVPMAIKLATSTYRVGGPPFIFIPLHKGADGFMSTEQFAKFYWPTYEKMLLGIIDAGLIPISFAEGGYNHRLDYIAVEGKVPAGRSMWMFDQTDMKTAKEKLGHISCIGGNVPTSMLTTGTPQGVEEYCKKLFEDAAGGGGFFLSPGAVVQDARPENVHALLNSSRKFGVY